MNEREAIAVIGFLENCLNEDPNALSQEEWVGYRKRLEDACASVKDENYRQKGIEVIKSLNKHLRSNLSE